MNRRLSIRTSLIATVALFFGLSILYPGLAHPQETTKVAFVYVGPVGDRGWSYQHDQGRKYLEKIMGDKVKTTFVENVSVPESERVFEQLARNGHDVIFGTSFGFMDPMKKVASRFPDVHFEHSSGFKTAKNMNNYLGRMYQARYLSGMIAGAMTKKNLVGVVAAHPIPEVIRELNAFALGAQSMNPDVRVKVVWSNSWYDPGQEKQAAQSLLEDGADILTQYQDSPATGQAAKEAGALWIASNSDMRQFAPDHYLTSTIWNWGFYYVDTVREIRNGTWEVDEYWGGLETGTVGLGAMTDKVPHDLKNEVLTKQREIMAGMFHIFEGPIKDQDGNIRIKEGEIPNREKLWSMDWFVQGIEGRPE